ncbi:hypothetical protein N656DRAFT_783796 [Canariomyces notabilis]|uniref:Uncharacterized protein n=1 Tax=Canariomyces notabilis TaxID=2074819 RepID=A0AAN6T8M5_9PEZI|nr:hypothetical protein N656DRAFT_783796 [Canariomyces arenarius]
MTDAANRLAFPPPTTPGTSPTDFITYIERLYTLATAYLATPGSHEVKSPNKAVMQWLRHKEYAGPAFQRTLGNLDAQWIAHVTKSGLTMIDWVADPLQPVSIKVSHFGAALDGVTLESKMQTLANILDSRLNISDLLGWAGDLITFYVDWQVAARASKTKLAGDDFCLERLAQSAYKKMFDTTAKLRDFVEDVDAYNIGMALMADPKRTIVQEVKELFRPAGGYTKRFQRFWKARLGGSVKTAADLANHLLSTDSLVDGIAYARERIIAGKERNRKISPPIVRPEALGASTRMEFCEGFAQVMEQLAAFG